MIIWENLSKTYTRRRLFSDLSGELEPGNGLMVYGANGSGKSSFLKILVGLTTPDSGRVDRRIGLDNIGYAAPQASLYGELTGRENIEFFARLRGQNVSQGEVQRCLDRVGLTKAGSKQASHYSTGMIQRLKLACAIVHNPLMLALDEPTIGLDTDGVYIVGQVLDEHIGAGGRSAIIATNDASHFAQFNWSSCTLGA